MSKGRYLKQRINEVMQVNIAVWGRFHAFDLANQLCKKDSLNLLITTYPTFKGAEFEIKQQYIKSLLYLELFSRTWKKIPNRIKKNNFQLFWLEWFDRDVVKSLEEGFDIFVGWSGACFWSIQKAKEMGAMTIIERGSSHMAYQTEILEEEYDRWGLKFTATHPGVYEREIQSYAECDRISIPSLFSKRTFIAQGIPESKLIHVPYGTSLRDFYPVKKKDDVFRVIYCGGINLRKGVPYLLQAFYELQLPNAELWLVGTLDPEIESFLKKYSSDQIVLKGAQSQNQLRWYYSQCSVFCIASIEEGIAMVQPQAMACGLPIIHTTNTGGEDVVRDGIDGFCIPIRDVEAIKEKIVFFHENPDLRAEMGKNALERARTSLSWDAYGDKILQEYSNLLVTKNHK
jgi:glycosyltransferase involved in cell wall biosynthesis